MQNIPRWKKSDRGSSHFRHGLDPRLTGKITNYKCGVICNGKLDINIVRLLKKAVLYFTKIQFGGWNQ